MNAEHTALAFWFFVAFIAPLIALIAIGWELAKYQMKYSSSRWYRIFVATLIAAFCAIAGGTVAIVLLVLRWTRGCWGWIPGKESRER